MLLSHDERAFGIEANPADMGGRDCAFCTGLAEAALFCSRQAPDSCTTSVPSPSVSSETFRRIVTVSLYFHHR